MRFFILIFAVFIFGLSASTEEAGPDVTQVSAAFEAWKTDPDDKKKTKALKEALAAYEDDPAVETLNAHIGLLGHAVKKERPRDLRQTALAAAIHLEPVADVVPQQYGQAAYIAAIALFNDRQSPDAIVEIAEVEGRMLALRDENGERFAYAEDLHYKAKAWRGAMEAYFMSIDRRQKIDDEAVEAILSKWEATDEQVNRRTKAKEALGDFTELPFCEGELLRSPEMKYPRGGASKGMFGSLIIRFAFDETGQVIQPEVLASIPFEEFEEEVKKTVVKWSWQPADPAAVGVSCGLSRENVIQQFVFAID